MQSRNTMHLLWDETAILYAVSDLLSRIYPRERVEKALGDLATAERETTSRATAAPRLKWETDRLPDENPAAFAWRAYEPEAKAGTLHRGIIYSEDRELHRRLNSWLRSHAMPEGIDIPTRPEWNDRQVARGAGLPVVSDEVREYHRARERVARARRRGVTPPM
jgi:hypothetical protein